MIWRSFKMGKTRELFLSHREIFRRHIEVFISLSSLSAVFLSVQIINVIFYFCFLVFKYLKFFLYFFFDPCFAHKKIYLVQNQWNTFRKCPNSSCKKQHGRLPLDSLSVSRRQKASPCYKNCVWLLLLMCHVNNFFYLTWSNKNMRQTIKVLSRWRCRN